MSCSNNRHKSCHDKSCQRYYNNAIQPFIADTAIQLEIAGAKVVDSGIAIDTEPLNYTINKTGLYHIAADLVITAVTAGIGTLRVYLDGVPLPCTIRTVSLPVGNTEIHTETDLRFDNCCCDVSHSITFMLEPGDAVGSVTEFCSGVLKLA